ncbi:type II toxin-antitoxin system RelE family toxin [Flavobacterium sp. SM2513]|uniref:type II toxin-antitoxin system RelE family toxin n=1 Tax=Flavobacterium sp. SM2513 TaxID=3424766 RepID=UPI003D7FCA44
MIVEFSKKFLKDIEKISDNQLKGQIGDAIILFETADTLFEINNVKKLKGHQEAYRFRLGKYRIGFYCDGIKVEMERFLKRNDIYNLFP